MATISTINVGTSSNDNTGDTLRNAFIKTNDNFTSVNSDLSLKATLASPTFTGTMTTNSDAIINSVRIGRGGGNISTNIAIGANALNTNTSGNYNTAIGVGALVNTNFNNTIGLGDSAQVTADNQVQIGNSLTTTYVYGTVQNRSDLRDKTEVRDTILGLDFISKLRPIDYKWDMREDYKTEMPSPLSEDATEEEKDAHKIVMNEWLESVKLDNLTHDGTHTRNRYHHGLIAQEVQDLGIDFGGFQDHKINGGQDVLSIGYDELIAPMIKAIQELKAEIELLKAK